MPGMSGLELTRILRSKTAYRALKIISLTANAFEEDKLISMEAGADDFLAKPFQAEDLFEKIANVLGVSYALEAGALPDILIEDVQTEPQILLSDLPPDLLAKLQAAACEADLDLLLELAQELKQFDPWRTSQIIQAAENYDYTNIMLILEVT